MRKQFTLSVNGDNPTDHALTGGETWYKSDFDDYLAKGKLTICGIILQGNLPQPTEADASATQKCIVVYVGGTAYRICA